MGYRRLLQDLSCASRRDVTSVAVPLPFASRGDAMKIAVALQPTVGRSSGTGRRVATPEIGVFTSLWSFSGVAPRRSLPEVPFFRGLKPHGYLRMPLRGVRSRRNAAARRRPLRGVRSSRNVATRRLTVDECRYGASAGERMPLRGVRNSKISHSAGL